MTVEALTESGPMELSINNVDAVEALHGPHSECSKGPWYDLGGVGRNLHRTRDKLLHDRQRPFWEKGFTSQGTTKVWGLLRFELIRLLAALEAQIKHIDARVKRLVNTVSQRTDHDISTHLYALGFELMLGSTFSRESNVAQNGEVQRALESMMASQSQLGIYGHVPWLYPIAGYIPSILAGNEAFTTFARRMVDERRKHKPTAPDLFSYLFETENNPDSAAFPLEWESRLAIVAGR